MCEGSISDDVCSPKYPERLCNIKEEMEDPADHGDFDQEGVDDISNYCDIKIEVPDVKIECLQDEVKDPLDISHFLEVGRGTDSAVELTELSFELFSSLKLSIIHRIRSVITSTS